MLVIRPKGQGSLMMASKYVYFYPNKQSYGRHVAINTNYVQVHPLNSHCGSYIVSHAIPLSIDCRVIFDMLKNIMGGL